MVYGQESIRIDVHFSSCCSQRQKLFFVGQYAKEGKETETKDFGFAFPLGGSIWFIFLMESFSHGQECFKC